MLWLGIIRPSSSNWASLLNMVPKKTAGDWCPCEDYCASNNATIPDRYPILHMQDFTATLTHETTIFWKLDLVWAYHQIPVEPSDMPKTSVITPFELFKFVRMPFGLRNKAQTLQRFMDQVLHGLIYAYNYITDLLIASNDSKEQKKTSSYVLWMPSRSRDCNKPIKMRIKCSIITVSSTSDKQPGHTPIDG